MLLTAMGWLLLIAALYACTSLLFRPFPQRMLDIFFRDDIPSYQEFINLQDLRKLDAKGMGKITLTDRRGIKTVYRIAFQNYGYKSLYCILRTIPPSTFIPARNIFLCFAPCHEPENLSQEEFMAGEIDAEEFWNRIAGLEDEYFEIESSQIIKPTPKL